MPEEFQQRQQSTAIDLICLFPSAIQYIFGDTESGLGSATASTESDSPSSDSHMNQ
jgi:hypothetical protein